MRLMRGALAFLFVLLWRHATAQARPIGVLADFAADAGLRLVLLRRSLSNQVELSCRNASTLAVLSAADFWLTSGSGGDAAAVLELKEVLASVSIPYRLPNPALAQIAFTMRPDTEGFFFCGNLSTRIQSLNNVTLLAYPTPKDDYLECYRANESESVTIDCPFHKGLLEQYYTLFWVHNYRLVFAAPREEFVVNSSDFSLTIREVSRSDQGMYQCWLQVGSGHGGNAFISPQISIYLEVESENHTTNVCPTATITTSTSQSLHLLTTLNMPISTQKVERVASSKFPIPKFVMVSVSAIILATLVPCIALAIMAAQRARKRPVKWKPRNQETVEMVCVENAGSVRPNVGTTLQVSSPLSSASSSETPSNVSANVSPNCSPANSHNGLREVECVADVHISADNTPRPSPRTIFELGLSRPSSLSSTGAIASSSSERTLTPCAMDDTLEQQRERSESDSGRDGECTREIELSEPGDAEVDPGTKRRSTPVDLTLKPNPKPFTRPCLSLSSVTSPTHQLTNLMSPGSFSYTRSNPSQSADTLVLLQPTEDYQDDTNNFVFLGSTQVLVCDAQGGKYEVSGQGISVQIPCNALDSEAHIEVGVAIHGAFKFPDDRKPISAIIWLLVREDPHFVFKKPVEIHLPHFLNLSNSDIDHNKDEFGLGFITTNDQMDDRERLIFTEGAKENVVYLQRSAKIRVKHFCFLCLCAKEAVVLEKSRYLLTQVSLSSANILRWDIHFCISYDLESFAKMIRDQYSKPKEAMDFSETPFQFAASSEFLKIRLEYQPSANGWRVAFQNSQQVKMSAVHEIWRNDVSDLQAYLKLKAYPPRISATVLGDGAFDNAQATVSFEGACNEQSLYREVHLALPREYVDKRREHLRFLHSQSQPAPVPNPCTELARSASGPPVVTAVPCEPNQQELLEVMKKILGKFTSWPILINALEIPEHRGQEILQEKTGVRTQILRILNTWVDMHREDQTCTRANLAAILRRTDDSLIPAARILEQETPYRHAIKY